MYMYTHIYIYIYIYTHKVLLGGHRVHGHAELALCLPVYNRIAIITTINRIAIITTINRIAIIPTINKIATEMMQWDIL